MTWFYFLTVTISFSLTICPHTRESDDQISLPNSAPYCCNSKRLTSPHEVSMPTTADRARCSLYFLPGPLSKELKSSLKEEEGDGPGDVLPLNDC